MASTDTSLKRSTVPLGQRTSTESILLTERRPKWTLKSLCEISLEPLRTSSVLLRPPALTVILTPIPSRLERVPTVLNATQGLLDSSSLTSRLGGAFMLLITIAKCPLFRKSPTASPRADETAVMPGPAAVEASANVPCRCCGKQARFKVFAAQVNPVHFGVNVPGAVRENTISIAVIRSRRVIREFVLKMSGQPSPS